MLDGETGMLAQELPEGFPLVGGGIIRQHNDWAAQVPQQLTQKHTDLFLGDVVKEEQIVEAESVSPKSWLPGEPTKSPIRPQKLSGHPAPRRFFYPRQVFPLFGRLRETFARRSTLLHRMLVQEVLTLLELRRFSTALTSR